MTLAREAADLFQAHRDELGFVNEAQCREKDLYTVKRGGQVIGAALANHCVRKPQTTLYEIAVEEAHRRQGIATELLTRLCRDSPHEKLVAKCPEDLAANAWYQSTGWDLVDVESGKNRRLNVYEYAIDSIDIITTGRPDLTQYAHKHGWLSGCRLDALGNYNRAGISPDFIDMHWEDPNRKGLLQAVKEHKPQYAIAGDYDGENIADVNSFAERLKRHVENVIIVPHEPGEISHVPEWAVVGYSTPTKYAGTDAPIWEYTGRDVHILGGTMPQIKTVVDHLKGSIVSLDTNTMHRDATQFGEYWSPSGCQRKQIPTQGNTVREAYENSVVNMTYALESWGLL